jgi:hypothetical protein
VIASGELALFQMIAGSKAAGRISCERVACENGQSARLTQEKTINLKILLACPIGTIHTSRWLKLLFLPKVRANRSSDYETARTLFVRPSR